jgi:NAD+ synthase (glutamine-hydrolysing)
VRIALSQLNPTVGGLDHNAGLILGAAKVAAAQNADVLVLPELAICGYPPRDLLRVNNFPQACLDKCLEIAAEFPPRLTVVLGTPRPVDHGTGVANSVVVLRGGELIATYDKRLLPTYDVFDEDRYFEPGNEAVVIEVGSSESGGIKLGLTICEDLWRGQDINQHARYRGEADPVQELVDLGAQIILSPSASPFVLGKPRKHREILRHHATRHRVPVLATNQVGANDDLVFDGHACAIGANGELLAAAPGFVDHLLVVDLDNPQPVIDDPLEKTSDGFMAIEALTIGVRDYLHKTGFKAAVLGLSGGIDSALTAAIAVRALGKENVTGVAMPSKFSSDHSVTDAYGLAKNLGITCLTVPIEPAFETLKGTLDPAFTELGFDALGEKLPDLTQENLQSRIRGGIIMALSNRTGALVLTTGNKSELAVGYCTLYGDMNGGLAVLADVPKTLVFDLSRLCNEKHKELGFDCPPIPVSTITKPPSAELAPDQLDSDSLPDYEILDAIVQRHVEGHQSAAEIIEETSLDPATVKRICRLIDLNEYKRRQLATGIKITSVAFGPGRRFPIAQRWVR